MNTVMSTRRRSCARSLVVAALSLAAGGFSARPARPPSLADVAKKEEERRQKTAEPTKVYTNKDLKTPSGPAGAPPAQTPPDQTTSAADAPKDSATDDKAGADKDAAADKDPVKNQAYWSGRLKALQSKLDQDQAYADAMQTH